MQDIEQAVWSQKGSSTGSHGSRSCHIESGVEADSSDGNNVKVPKRVQCQVPGCAADLLEGEKPYCIKKRLCADHMRADAVLRRGHGDQQWRFCFQCGKLEPLSLFEGSKRSCRSRLQKRRQPPRRCTTWSSQDNFTSAAQQHQAAAAAAAYEEEIADMLNDSTNDQQQTLATDPSLQGYSHSAVALGMQMQQQLLHLQQQRQLLKGLRAELRATYAARPEAMTATRTPSIDAVTEVNADRVFRRAPRKAVSMITYPTKPSVLAPAAAAAAEVHFPLAASQTYLGVAWPQVPGLLGMQEAAAAAADVCSPLQFVNGHYASRSGACPVATAPTGPSQFPVHNPLQPPTPIPLSAGAAVAAAAISGNKVWPAGPTAAACGSTAAGIAPLTPAGAADVTGFTDVWTELGGCQQGAMGNSAAPAALHLDAAATTATAAAGHGGVGATNGAVGIDDDVDFEDLLQQIPDDDLMGEIDQLINLDLHDDLPHGVDLNHIRLDHHDGVLNHSVANSEYSSTNGHTAAASARDTWSTMPKMPGQQQNMQQERTPAQVGMDGTQHPAAAAAAAGPWGPVFPAVAAAAGGRQQSGQSAYIAASAVQPDVFHHQQQQLLQSAGLLTAANTGQVGNTAAAAQTTTHAISGHSLAELQQQLEELQQVTAQARCLIDSSECMQPGDIAAVTQYIKGQLSAAIHSIREQNNLASASSATGDHPIQTGPGRRVTFS